MQCYGLVQLVTCTCTETWRSDCTLPRAMQGLIPRRVYYDRSSSDPSAGTELRTATRSILISRTAQAAPSRAEHCDGGAKKHGERLPRHDLQTQSRQLSPDTECLLRVVFRTCTCTLRLNSTRSTLLRSSSSARIYKGVPRKHMDDGGSDGNRC